MKPSTRVLRRVAMLVLMLVGLLAWTLPEGCAWAQASVTSLPGHTSAVRSVAISPDGRLVISGGDDGTMRLWDIASRRQLKASRPGGDRVDAVGFWRGGQGLVACGSDRVMFYSLPEGRVLRSLRIPRKGQLCRIFNPDVTRLLDADEQSLVMWNLTTGKRATGLDLAKYPGGKQVRCMAFSPEGRWIMVGCATWDEAAPGRPSQSALWQLDLKTRNLRCILPSSGFALDAAAWNGDVAVIGGILHPEEAQGGWVNLVRDGKAIAFATLEYTVSCLAVNPEGTLVAVGAGELQIWELTGGAARESLGPRPTALAFGPPGSGLLVAGYEDGMVRVFHLTR